jgi:hypothetical protein
MHRLSKVLGIFSLLTLAISLCMFVWEGVYTFVPGFMHFAIVFALLLLLGLTGVNAVFLLFASGFRKKHMMLAGLMALTVFWLFSLVADRHNALQERWFLSTGWHQYERMARKILENKSILTDHPKELNEFMGTNYDYGIHGWTNADGSVTIVFNGRDNLSRRQYEYYSGNQMEVTQENTNLFRLEGSTNQLYFHLTNNWYAL